MNLEARKTYLIFFYRLLDFIVPGGFFYLLNLFIIHSSGNVVYYTLGVLSSVIFIIIMNLTNSYNNIKAFHASEKLKATTLSWFFVVIILVFLTFLITKETHILSRRVVVIWFFLTPVILFFLKIFVNKLYLSKSEKKNLKVLIIGEDYKFNKHEEKYLHSLGIIYHYINVVNNKNHIEDINKQINTFKPDYLINNLKKLAEESLIKHLINIGLAGHRFITLNNFMEIFLRKCYISYKSFNLEYLSEITPYRTLGYSFKRFIDYTVAFMILLSALPILPFIVYRIKKEDPGPTFYQQTRYGKGGKKFIVNKFRTMYQDAKFNPYTKEKDSRILPIGHFLRRMRIDEIPQLWNVIKGDLHLFGPRTEWDIFIEKYEKEIPYYHERHLVRPGISGWAQVMYPYGANIEDARQKLMYDLYYLKNWNIWLEVETILRTIKVVLNFEGR